MSPVAPQTVSGFQEFKNGLKTIDYGRGTIKPYLWGYQSPKQSKKKRKV